MNQQELEQALRSVAGPLRGRPGFWETEIDGVKILVISDVEADRVRVVAPIHPVEGEKGEYLYALLSANFDRALDAKYAVFKDHVWAVFLHELGSLTQGFFVSGLHQVATLVKNTPGSFASSDLVFGPAEDVESN